MRFFLLGQLFEIKNLTEELDIAFVDLHTAFLSNGVCQWDKFRATTHQFFDNATHAQQDNFFNNFTILWNQLLRTGQLNRAEELWKMAVSIALEWEEQHQGNHIHKGTPFYFWGMTAILRGDIDLGYALMHRAVEEDVRATGNAFPGTPAFALVTLNSQKVDQAFRAWVLQKASFIENFLNNFRNMYQRNLTLNDVQNRFLLNPPNRDSVFLLSYAVARFLRLEQIPQYALESEFASQLYLNLLFDITLVIDTAVKQHNPMHWRFIEQATFLSQQAQLGITQNALGEINGNFQNNFDGTLRALLDNNYTLQGGNQILNLERDLAVVYGIRNFAAHNLTTVRAVGERFKEIRQSTFNILFLIIETLY